MMIYYMLLTLMVIGQFGYGDGDDGDGDDDDGDDNDDDNDGDDIEASHDCENSIYPAGQEPRAHLCKG